MGAPCGKQGVEATPLEIKGAPQDDSSLRGLFEVAKEGEQKEVREGTVMFQVNKGVPGFYKLPDRTGDVAVGHTVQVQWEGNGSWPWGSHVGSSREGKDCRQDYEQLLLARSAGQYKAILCVLWQLSEGKSKREHKEGAVGEGQKLSIGTLAGEGQKLSIGTLAGEGQKLSFGTPAGEGQKLSIGTPAGEGQKLSIGTPTGEGQKLSIGTPAGEGQKLSIGTPAGEGQKLSIGTPTGEGQKLSIGTPAGEGQKLSIGTPAGEGQKLSADTLAGEGRKGAIHSEGKASFTANPETAGYVQDIHSSSWCIRPRSRSTVAGMWREEVPSSVRQPNDLQMWTRVRHCRERMLGGSLESTKVPKVLVWQGVRPGNRSPANLKKRSGVAVGHDSSAQQILIIYIPGRENVGAGYMSRAGML